MGANLFYQDDKVEAHDRQIEALIRLAAEHRAEMAEHRAQMKELDARIANLVRATESLERQWQAHLNTLPRQ